MKVVRVVRVAAGVSLLWRQVLLTVITLVLGLVSCQPADVEEGEGGLTPGTKVESARLSGQAPILPVFSFVGSPNPPSPTLVVQFPVDTAPFGSARTITEQTAPKLSPAVHGTWLWVDPTRLVFRPTTPSESMVPNKAYSIDLTPLVVRSGVTLSQLTHSLITPPFEITLHSCSWSDDREAPIRRSPQVSASANYPVYLSSLQPRVDATFTLAPAAGAEAGTTAPPQPAPLSIGFVTSPEQGTAHVRLKPMVIPYRDGTVDLSLKPGEIRLYKVDGPVVTLGEKQHCSLPAERQAWLALEADAAVPASGIAPYWGKGIANKPLQFPLLVPITQIEGSPDKRGPVGARASSGVELSPPHPGNWQYNADTHLAFLPLEPWVPGTKFQVTVNSFPGLTFERPLLGQIAVPVPVLELESLSLYNDPADPARKRVTATVTLSYPFARGSLEPRTTLQFRVEPQKSFTSSVPHLGFTIVYDEKQPKRAYLKSEPFVLPEEPGEMRLAIDRGVTAETGGEGTAQQRVMTLAVPRRSEFLQVASATTSEAVQPDGSLERLIATTFTAPLADPASLPQYAELYLLPPCEGSNPAVQLLCKEKNITSWSAASEVDSRVLTHATRVPVTWKSTLEPERMTHLLSFTSPEKRQLLLVIKEGISAAGGLSLAKPFRSVVSLGGMKRELRIMHEGSLLSLSGDKRLGITSRGVKDIRVGLHRVTPRSVHHLVSLAAGTFQQPATTIPLDHFVEEFTYNESVPTNEEMERAYSAVDFSRFLRDDPAPRGLFLLTLRSKADLPPPPDTSRLSNEAAALAREQYEARLRRVEPCPARNNRPSEFSSEDSEDTVSLCDQRLVLLTDLGLVAKRSAQGEDTLFVMSFRTGTPVSGAKVSLIGKNGVAIFERTTDSEGRTTVPSTMSLTAERKPTTYVVEKGGDFSFLPYDKADRRINLTRFDTGGLFNSEEFNALQGFVFSDRGVYRPGEEARFGLVVRTRGWSPLPDGLPLQVEVYDSRNKVVARQPVAFDKSGFSEYRYRTPEEGATGTYRLQLALVGGGSGDPLATLGGTPFRVEEFQPDRLQVQALLAEGSNRLFFPHKGRALSLTVRNLFGTPAAQNKVAAELTVSPWSGVFPLFPGYQFGRTVSTELPTHAESLGEKETDAAGNASFDLGLDRYDEPIFQFSVAGEGFEKGSGRSVVALASGIATSHPFLIGYRADGSLEAIPKDSTRKAHLIAIDATGTRIQGANLFVDIFEHRFESTLVKNPNGLFSYQSVEKVVPVSTQPYIVEAGGSTFEMPTSKPGRYRAVVRLGEGSALVSWFFTVVGEGDTSVNLERNAELELQLDKSEYQVGDTIAIHVVAPYQGMGIVTIESDRVHAHRWFRTTTTSSTQTITVPPAVQGNAYVSVAFVRSFASPEIYISPLSYGVAPFKVSRAPYRSPLILSVPDEVVPGTSLPVSLTLQHPGRSVVYAVDEGILQFARYRNPDPLEHFFRKRALQVSTFQILDLILPDYQLVNRESAPGGDEDSGAGKYRNPFGRKHKPPVAFWSGLKDLAAGSHSFSIPVPSYFSGSIRVLAYTASPERIGSAEARSVARGPFVIQPQQPYAVAPGDSFEVGALVSNNTKEDNLAVYVDIPGTGTVPVTVTSENPVRLTIPPGKDAPVRFMVTAGSQLGSVSVGYRVEGGGAAATDSEEMSIRPAQPLLVTSTQGSLSVDAQKRGQVAKFSSSRALFSEHRSVTATVSATPFGLLRGVIRYLQEYPYGCTEQIVSKAFPGLVLSSVPELGVQQSDAQSLIDSAIRTLVARQKSDGSFGVWSLQDDSNPLYSAYATHFLLTAESLGQSVPPFLVQQALSYLRSYGSETRYAWSEHRAQAYALFLLALHGDAVAPQIKKLDSELERQWHTGGTHEIWTRLFLAAAYKINHLDAEAQRLYQPVAKELEDAGTLPAAIQGDAAALGLFLYVSTKYFSETLPPPNKGAYRWELVQEMLKGRVHSFTGSFAVLGASQLWSAFGAGSLGGFTLNAQSGAGKSVPVNLSGAVLKYGAVPEDNVSFTLSGDGSAQLYYQVTEGGFDRERAATPQGHGISLMRELLGGDGGALPREASGAGARLAIRDSLLYRLTLNPTQPIKDLAVVVIIPGGFEIDLSEQGLAARKSLPVAGKVWEPRHVEVLEDRVLLFGDVALEASQFAFALKPLTKGTYQVPPLFAEGMYDPELFFRGVSDSIVVTE